MENIEKRECVIGIINDYDSTRMTTLDGLKYHIKDRYDCFDEEDVKRLKMNIDYWVPIPEPPQNYIAQSDLQYKKITSNGYEWLLEDGRKIELRISFEGELTDASR